MMDRSRGKDRGEKDGLPYALGAYLVWGLFPLYFRAMAGVGPLEILSHRVVWSVAVLGLVLAATGRLGDLRNVFRRPRTLLTLALTYQLDEVLGTKVRALYQRKERT